MTKGKLFTLTIAVLSLLLVSPVLAKPVGGPGGGGPGGGGPGGGGPGGGGPTLPANPVLVSPTDLGLTDFNFIPLHNPLVEGIHGQNGDNGDLSDGERQIRTYVAVQPTATDLTSGMVHFVIGNFITVGSDYLSATLGGPTGLSDNPVQSPRSDFFIGDIYIFDFGDILQGNGAITGSSSGVDYKYHNSSGHLQGGGNVDKTDKSELGANAYNGDVDHTLNEHVAVTYKKNGGHKGIDPGEWVRISFNYEAISPASLFAQVDQIFIGFHGQGFDERSASFWTTMPLSGEPIPPTSAVPEPSTLVLLGIGLAGTLAWRRRLHG